MPDAQGMLRQVRTADDSLTARYRHLLRLNPDLDRRLVSFQANRAASASRWFRYREGFSAALMRYVFEALSLTQGRILDPFAGSGTALFVASERGLDATGIELLPSSAESIEVRRLLLSGDQSRMTAGMESFLAARSWQAPGPIQPFPHVRITQGAFPSENERKLGRYLCDVERVADPPLARVLRFAALCVLEEISYTRKDGQYLRWDSRAGGRAGGRSFDKGTILDFSEAVTRKLGEMIADVRHQHAGGASYPIPADPRTPARTRGHIDLLAGSCLDLLPALADGSFDGVVTSPPYCNRYDYTRTYALELAMLGVGEQSIRRLRQDLLSCTVENRDKVHLIDRYGAARLEAVGAACVSQDVLRLALVYLEACRENGSINNPGIPRMLRNYFTEMALVIAECARVLKPGAPLVMVNDNVRYQGAHLPVDLILADIARGAGFDIEVIWVLPRGKGNSSQQMGTHGREELRKCVYVWRRGSDQLDSLPRREARCDQTKPATAYGARAGRRW